MFDPLIGTGAEFVNHANQLRLYRRAARLAGNEAHLADGRMWPQTTHADWLAASLDHDPDSPVQEEMHGIGWIALAHDNLPRLDFGPFAVVDQLISILSPGERFNKPFASFVEVRRYPPSALT